MKLSVIGKSGQVLDFPIVRAFIVGVRYLVIDVDNKPLMFLNHDVVQSLHVEPDETGGEMPSWSDMMKSMDGNRKETDDGNAAADRQPSPPK